MKPHTFYPYICVLLLVLFTYCAESPKEETLSPIEAYAANTSLANADWDPFQISVSPVSFSGELPALQSFAAATYGNYWILIGGRKAGLHSMDNDPPPFRNLTANDSLWLVDIENQTVTGVGVPAAYANYLSATNILDYQVGETLYLSGGFTTQNPGDTQLNWTSDRFFEISIPNLVQYIQTEGAAPNLDAVFTKVIQSPFVQVTGGEMMVQNNNFYLICGQNYQGTYSSGNTGTYTNAIRKFNLSNVSGAWTISDTLSVVDPVNLHRRDFNLLPAINASNDSLRAVIFGGVFTSDGLGYRSPVYIGGLASGQPSITVDTTLLQKVNLYSSAQVLTGLKSFYVWINHHSLLGGISYMYYDTKTDSLKIPQTGMELPFSNTISSLFTDGATSSLEAIQLPPQEMLPTYLGTNATFFPDPAYIMEGTEDIMDLGLILNNDTNQPIPVGYMMGGIQSDHPNTETPSGIYPTRVNPKLYQVFMSIEKGD